MILVLVESEGGNASEISLETLAFARSLAELGGGIQIRAVVVGNVENPQELGAELGAHGVSEVHQAVGEAFDSFAGAAWAAALQSAREATGSVVVLAAGSPRGNEVLAHLAARLDVPMAANVVSFSGLAPFVVTRQVVGGAALEEMRLDQRPAVLSVAGHSWTAAPAESPLSAAWHEFAPEVNEADLVARVMATGQKEPDHSDSLKSARVVVGAGRGAGGPDGFAAAIELAELLHGS
ncbi:MAG: electron transfer flavoprotein subunit alpha/FixB family protein, partial [Actinomycetota bacterium]|nr:electron transfer flavoprotein subunit alpha/FixB family protein [Actinomycetota bacterium]